MPATVTDDLAFSSQELLLIAGVIGVTPLLPLPVADLDEHGVAAVVHGLLARGAVLHSDEGGLSIAEHLRPLLGVALLADRATTVSVGHGEELHVRLLLRADELAVEDDVDDDGVHRLRPIHAGQIEGAVLEAIRSDGDPSSELVPDAPQELSTPAFIEFMQRIGAGDVDGAQGSQPALAEFATFVATDPGSVQLSDVRPGERAADPERRALGLLVAEGEWWQVDARDETVRIERLTLDALIERVRDVVA